MDYIEGMNFSQPWPEGPVYGGKYDLVLYPLSAMDGPACNRYHSNKIPSASNPNGINVTWFSMSDFDNLCIQALTSLNDGHRIRLHQEAQHLWGGELPAIPLFWYPLITGVGCQVNGYQVDPKGNELWNIEEISFRDCNK